MRQPAVTQRAQHWTYLPQCPTVAAQTAPVRPVALNINMRIAEIIDHDNLTL